MLSRAGPGSLCCSSGPFIRKARALPAKQAKSAMDPQKLLHLLGQAIEAITEVHC